MKKTQQSQSGTSTNPYAIQQFNSATASLPKAYTPLSGAQIQGYMNPFQSSVIDATMARAHQDQQMGLNQIGDQAIHSGAFGGTRQGVAEGIARGQFDLNNQQTIAGLNAANYGQALQTAQGENSAANQYPLAIQALLGQLAQGTQQNTTGKSTGTQFGFGWNSKNGFSLG